LRGKRVLITGASKGIGAAAMKPSPKKAATSRLPPAAAINWALADRLRSATRLTRGPMSSTRKSEDLARLAKDA
jgi:NAD(P)-dependent dehydrogenase (short-subunit alcohol dehydrogenase family)